MTNTHEKFNGYQSIRERQKNSYDIVNERFSQQMEDEQHRLLKRKLSAVGKEMLAWIFAVFIIVVSIYLLSKII